MASRRTVRLVSLAVAAVAAGLTLWLLYRGEGDTLTEEALADARDRWRSRGPSSYDLDIEVSGAPTTRHHVEVRDGKVVAMTTNGIDAPVRSRAAWSVEGMFDTLAAEMRNRARPKMPYGVDDPDRVVLQAAFDGETGYPRHFLRHVLGAGRGGIEWQVVALRPRGP